MNPVNWSERVELGTPGLHDCAEAAILDCLIYGGKTSFPLGIYTPEEREALEHSKPGPYDVGATPTEIDLAVHNRYGLTLHAGSGDKRTLLETPGLAVSVGGNLVTATYRGGHRKAFLTTPKVWLDPLAPNKSAGVPTTVQNVLDFSAGRDVSDLRYVKANEFLQGGTGGGIDLMGLRIRVPSPAVAGRIDAKQGTPALRVSDGVANPNGLDADATNRDAYAADVVNDDGSTHATGYVLNLTRSGVTEGWFIARTDVPAGAFTPNAAPAATKLAPGLYEVA